MASNNDDIPPIPTPPQSVPPVESAPAAPETVAQSAPPPAAAPAPPPEPLAPPAARYAPPTGAGGNPPPYAPPMAGQPAANPSPYGPVGYGPPSYNAYAPPAAAQPQGLSVASLVCGIVGLLASFAALGLFPAIAAIITGHLAQGRQPRSRGLWLTGLITGYLGLAIWLLTIAAFVVFGIIANAEALVSGRTRSAAVVLHALAEQRGVAPGHAGDDQRRGTSAA